MPMLLRALRPSASDRCWCDGEVTKDSPLDAIKISIGVRTRDHVIRHDHTRKPRAFGQLSKPDHVAPWHLRQRARGKREQDRQRRGAARATHVELDPHVVRHPQWMSCRP